MVAVVWLLTLVYSAAYLVVAFASESTIWWWWFVPIYGTFKIFQASVLLGLFHVGILVVVYVAGFLASDSH
jgi:hypothetical protein